MHVVVTLLERSRIVFRLFSEYQRTLPLTELQAEGVSYIGCARDDHTCCY